MPQRAWSADAHDARALLTRQWHAARAAARDRDALPPYQEVALGSLGRAADATALLFVEAGEIRIARAGDEVEGWLGASPGGARVVADLEPDRARILDEILRGALHEGAPVIRPATRVVGGTVEIRDLLALPLATPLGPGALVHLGAARAEISLGEAVLRSASDGMLALAAIRAADGTIDDFQVVAANEGVAGLLGLDAGALLWKRTSELRGMLPDRGILGRLHRVLATGEREVFEASYPRPGGELHLRLSAANLGDLVAMTLTDVTGLKAREASFRLLFETNPVPMYVFDRESLGILAVNDAALDQYGYGRNAFQALSVTDLMPDDERAAPPADDEARAADRAVRHRRADGSELLIATYARTLDHDGRPAALVAAVDVTERKRALAELQRTRAFLDAVVENVPAMLFVRDARDHALVLFNRAGEETLGVRREEVIGRSSLGVLPPDQEALARENDRAVIEGRLGHAVDETTVRTRHKGERLLRTRKIAVRDGEGQPRYLVGISEDITEQREQERRIAYLAHHDALTDLPNRVLLRERLTHALDRLPRGGHVAVHCLDLDGFKAVNDTFGHAAGDAVLREVANRLRQAAGETDVVARLGGDEFAIVQVADRPDAVRRLAERVSAALNQPFAVEGQALPGGASIGIAVSPDDGERPDDLLRSADLALYQVKADGRRAFRFFEPQMNERVQARRALERDLRQALADAAFELYYQPLVDVGSGAVSGFEALLRWRHATRGFVSPAEFIPLAEEIGLIGPLGDWVLRQACREAAGWPRDVKVAVNLSPVQFRDGGRLPLRVAAALAESGLAPRRLELEVTESVFLDASAENIAVLHQLRALGVRISLDDFGTGYSSLSYLRSFPFDKLKIDQSFVRELDRDPDCEAIVRAITGLGRSLGIATVAEGVETREQLDRLRAQGCGEVQGYLFSPPRPAAEVPGLLGRLAGADALAA